MVKAVRNKEKNYKRQSFYIKNAFNHMNIGVLYIANFLTTT